MPPQPSPRLTLIQSIAEEIGLSRLAEIEARAVRYRPIPRRLLVRLILAAGEHPELTPREHEVMYWLCQGKSRAEIGEEMHRSTETVKNHLKRIFRKLGVSNSIQAVVFYLDSYAAHRHDHGDQSRPDATK